MNKWINEWSVIFIKTNQIITLFLFFIENMCRWRGKLIQEGQRAKDNEQMIKTIELN